MWPAYPLPTEVTASQLPCHLLRLPTELRLAIFEKLFHGAHLVFDIYGNQWPDLSGPGLYRRNLHVAIFGTCRKVYHEASQLFWTMLHLCIEAETLVRYQDEGIWGPRALANIVSIRPRLQNIVIGFQIRTQYRHPPEYARLRPMITVISSFASELRLYPSLRTCTVSQFSYLHFPNLLCPVEGDEDIHSLYQKLRCDLVEGDRDPPWCVLENQRHEPFPWGRPFLPSRGPESWQEALKLLLNRRHDPYNQRFLTNRHGNVEYDPSTSMKFEISLVACIDFEEAPPEVENVELTNVLRPWGSVWPRLVLRSKIIEGDNFNFDLNKRTILSPEWKQPRMPELAGSKEVDESAISMFQDVVSCLNTTIN